MKIKQLYIIVALVLLPVWSSANKVADSLYDKALYCFETGDYDQMLEYALRGLALTEKGTCVEKANGNLKVGRAYYHLQQRSLALHYLRQTLNIAKACGIDSFQRNAYRQMGAVYWEIGKIDSARLMLGHAERMLANTDEWGELASLYAITGELYRMEPKGKYYFDLAEKYAIRSGDPIVIGFAYMKLGIYANFHNDCRTAETHFRKALEYYRKAHIVEGEMYAMKCLALALSNCGKAEETYTLLSRHQAIRDSIFKKETADKTAHFRTLYETEKKERENAQLAQQNVVEKLRVAQQIKSKRILALSFFVSVLLLVVAFLFIYDRYRLRKQKEIDRRLAEQQELSFAAVIAAEEQERKRIAVDLHDGVGQTMSAAKINLSVLQNEMQFLSDEQRGTFDKIVALVDESCREVRSVSHSMMPNALLKSGLANAIRNFINQIDNRVLSVDFYTEGLDASLNANNEVVLYRVMQECVNNVIKHSGATSLYISLIKDEDGISATIEDNGKGFNTNSIENFEGIGLQNIKSRIGYLKGTVEWDSTPGKGTAVIINIPG